MLNNFSATDNRETDCWRRLRCLLFQKKRCTKYDTEGLVTSSLVGIPYSPLVTVYSIHCMDFYDNEKLPITHIPLTTDWSFANSATDPIVSVVTTYREAITMCRTTHTSTT